MEKVKFYLITDLHYYAPELGTSGKAYIKREIQDQVVLKESGAVIDAAIDLIIADKETNIVLIPGDLTNNGEALSHKGIIKKLQRLKDSGKKVYVTTATHDFNSYERFPEYSSESCYFGEEKTPAEPTPREALAEMYRPFGMDDAISIEEESMSYAVMLGKKTRLLALNDDGNGHSFCGYFPKCLDWIKQQAKEAAENHETIFAMTHHPLLPPMELYPAISKRDMLGDYKKMAAFLSDLGIGIIFTGHTHEQNVKFIETEKGNRIYDVNTASLVGHPSPIRKIELSQKEVRINTLHIESFQGLPSGMSVEEFFIRKFDTLVLGGIDAAVNDHEKLADILNGLSVPRSFVDNNTFLIKAVGKILDNVTVGTVSKLIGSRADYTDIKNMKVKNLVADVIRNLYGGEQFYAPGTAEYEATMGLVHKILELAKKFIPKEKQPEIINSFSSYISEILYDGGFDDNNCVLPLITERKLYN